MPEWVGMSVGQIVSYLKKDAATLGPASRSSGSGTSFASAAVMIIVFLLLAWAVVEVAAIEAAHY